MAYTKQNFENGKVLTAEQLNRMEEGIAEAVETADELKRAKDSGELDGDPGKSAYEYAKDGGYTGTEAEFGAKLAAEYPTKLSQFTNDPGYLTGEDIPVQSVNGKTGAVQLGAADVGARPNTWTPSHSDVGADKAGTASSAVGTHNAQTDAHNDIRLLISALAARMDALANSDDETLDQMAEVVAYIKDNRGLIEQITTGKVSVSDIVNNLTTNVSNKPLSAAQGVALKALIDAIVIPTKLSQLTNDKGYLTGYTETDPTVPAWAKQEKKPAYTAAEVGALAADTLPGAINTALAQAKESGEFDGKDYVLTEADKSEIVAMVIASLGGNPVFGYVDKNNNILVSGNLPDGTYSVKYEMEDGSTVNIGNLVLDTNVYYSVTNNLTNCTSNNSATQAVQGGSYSATITAKSGYEMSSIKVTMGGTDISTSAVSGGKITIANVTGNIVITAVATEKAKEPTNFAEYNADNTTDWNIWINNARAGSDGAYRSDTYNSSYGTPAVSNYVAVQNGDIVEFAGFYAANKNSLLCDSSKKPLSSQGTGLLTNLTNNLSNVSIDNGKYTGTFTINNASIAFVRVGGYVGMPNHPVSEISIKIKRNGEYL